MEAPTQAGSNQLTRLSDREERVRLLESLGLVPSDLAQNDFVLVVEGERDAQWIRTLFPVETARALLYVAGSSSQVLQTCRVFENAIERLSWVAVMDRDLASDEKVRRYREDHSNLLVWERREFENVLLEPALIARTIAKVGIEQSPMQVEETMTTLALSLKAEVVDSLATAELRSRIPVHHERANLSRLDYARAVLTATEQAFARRSLAFDEVVGEVEARVEASWTESWTVLADGKALAAALQSELHAFGSPQEFLTALLVTAREETDVQPAEISGLGERLRRAMRS